MQQLYNVKCARCNHQWIPRVMNPKRCPRCGSFYWQDEKKDVKHNGNTDRISESGTGAC
ncbi:MAG: hypothetical protein ACFFD4_07945 [Candidatus Odinarchaeota archaeon]